MEKNQNDTKSFGAPQITSSLLLSLNDESIQRVMAENLQTEDVWALEEIGQKLQKCAKAKLEEKFRDYYVTSDGHYADFGIKEQNLKRFASHIRNLKIMGLGDRNGKKTATFIETNFRNLRSIELKFVVVTHHLKNIFKNVDTIIFNNCFNDVDFCYHDDCLRYCKRLRCLRFINYGTAEHDEDKFNGIMRQMYSGLEAVQFDITFTPKMLKNWERFIQRNTNIRSLAIRFLNENEKIILKVVKTVVVNAINLQQLFLHLDFDARYADIFNFGIIHEHLAILDRREHYEYLGISLGSYAYIKIKNLDLCTSFRSLKLLDIGHTDPCKILPDISKYCKNVKVLSLYSFVSTCRLGDHQKLENTWNYHFLNLEELHFWKVLNAYFLIPLFIRHSPKLNKIVARGCKIVLEKNIEMSMKKFNDERAKVCISGEALIINSDQPNIQSNYQFNLVKLKRIDFEEIPFNEANPFEYYIEDKVGVNVFDSREDLMALRSMDSDYAEDMFSKIVLETV